MKPDPEAVERRIAAARLLYPDDTEAQVRWLAEQCELADRGLCAGYLRLRPVSEGRHPEG